MVTVPWSSFAELVLVHSSAYHGPDRRIRERRFSFDRRDDERDTQHGPNRRLGQDPRQS